jgi:hypothetical protein
MGKLLLISPLMGGSQSSHLARHGEVHVITFMKLQRPVLHFVDS